MKVYDHATTTPPETQDPPVLVPIGATERRSGWDERAPGYGYGLGGGGGGAARWYQGTSGRYGGRYDDVALPTVRDYESCRYGAPFGEAEVRRVFVRRVFGLVAMMTCVALGVSAAFLFVPEVKSWVGANPWTLWVAFVGFFGFMLILTCCPSMRLTAPHNYVLLVGFTLFLSFFVGVVVASYDSLTVLIAVAIVCFLVLALSAFATQTRVDFTLMHSMLFTLLVGLIVFGVLTIFFYSDILRVVYATLGAVLFSAYLVYDVQLLMGGRTYELGPEEHVLGAVVIFLDVINLFLMILQLVGIGRGE